METSILYLKVALFCICRFLTFFFVSQRSFIPFDSFNFFTIQKLFINSSLIILKNRRKSESLLLSLWGRYFLHVDPRHSRPACVSISRFLTGTFADQESHTHCALVDFLTDTFYVTYAVQILWSAATSILHVHSTINGCWGWTLCTVKGEIPSTAAGVTVMDAKSASPEDTYRCVVWQLLENTFLWKYK